MYRIALCDDEREELEKTEHVLASYQKQHTEYNFLIERFMDVEKLLCLMQQNEYMPDILFMDIYMPGKLGIEAAKELRRMGGQCLIVFLTTSKEYALEAFRVDAAQYLVKPVLEKEFNVVLDKLLRNLDKEQKKYLPLRIDNQIHRICVHDIVYCEAQKKCQCIYLADGTQHLLRMTMAKLYDMLYVYPEFAKVGIGYIINLGHVDSLDSRELNMDNGQRIYLPRGSYQPLREQYFNYYCEEE